MQTLHRRDRLLFRISWSSMGSIRIRVGVLLRAKQVGAASCTICWAGQASARKLVYTSGFERITPAFQETNARMMLSSRECGNSSFYLGGADSIFDIVQESLVPHCLCWCVLEHTIVRLPSYHFYAANPPGLVLP
jgi:hypothetical protein